MADFLTLDVDAGVGTIRLDRPPMNALNAHVQDELLAVCGEIRDRSDISAVVVFGGDKVFAPAPTSKRCRRCPTPTWSTGRRPCRRRSPPWRRCPSRPSLP